MQTSSQAKAEITIVQCSADLIRNKGDELFERHRHEMEPGSPDIDIDWLRYYEAEERGMLICMAVLSECFAESPYGSIPCQDLVGYSIAIVCDHPHYPVRICQHDAIYLLPGFRKGHVGLHLLQRTEEAARERGASRILWHAKPDSNLCQLLPHLGYHAEEIVFQKDM